MSINKATSREPIALLRYLPLAILLVVALSSCIYLRANTQFAYFDRISGPIINPLMGWAPWATIKESNQPHTLVYADLTWREFEPREGEYAFDAFEKKQQLARWRQEGKRVVFRFIADKPGNETHLDIPDWLFEKINGAGDYYDNEYGMGFSPDYSNSLFIKEHGKAINALGQRYGKDSFFAFIELGSLGQWGEWHTHPDIAPLPSEETKNVYVYQYAAAFPDTHLLMRRPFAIAQALGLGLYNDMTGDPVATNTWLDWIKNGAESSPLDTAGLSAMPDGWQKAPIGGEQTFRLSNEQIYGAGLEQTLELLQRSHTTFIGPGSPFNVAYGGSLQEGLDQVMATIGYRIHIDQVQLPRWVHYGKNLPIRCTFANSGSAPMYYNWPTRVYLFNENGEMVSTYQPRMDIRKVLPGEFFKITLKVPLDELENGTYSIGIGIVDPLTHQPAVQFANENPRQDRIQYLGAFEIKRLLKRAGPE